MAENFDTNIKPENRAFKFSKISWNSVTLSLKISSRISSSRSPRHFFHRQSDWVAGHRSGLDENKVTSFENTTALDPQIADSYDAGYR